MSSTKRNRVRILSDTVVNQIAAGEAVERPASVVKELIENSIDAGATEITVIAANGGRSAIEVVDDGCGMAKEDALLAIERFGTSKITALDDLSSIKTHGFRGEALPSIASVSHFTLRTSDGSESPGTEIQISGGTLRSVSEISAPRGTRIEVRNLFYNVPARKKFLRSEQTELGLVKAFFTDVALAYPGVRFALIADGREIASLPAARTFAERVEQTKIAPSGAIHVTAHAGGSHLRAEGLLSPPLLAVQGSGRLRLLVNRRSVRDRFLMKALRDGFGTMLPSGKYPAGVMLIEMNEEDLDVNVHPQKIEVRFRDSDRIFRFTRAAVAAALDRTRPAGFQPPSVMPQVFSAVHPAPESAHAAVQTVSWYSEQYLEQAAAHESPGAHPEASARSDREPLSRMRYVGQILSLYLLFEGSEKFAVLDMHAAHERVTFFKLKSQHLQGSVASQMLLVPELISLPAGKLADFESVQSGFRSIGIDAEKFGEDKLIVRALPAALGQLSAQSLFDDIFSLSSESDFEAYFSQGTDEMLSRLACHGSVRRGRNLEPAEAYELVESLEAAEASAFCPHGRPVAVFLTALELEKMFGRT